MNRSVISLMALSMLIILSLLSLDCFAGQTTQYYPQVGGAITPGHSVIRVHRSGSIKGAVVNVCIQDEFGNVGIVENEEDLVWEHPSGYAAIIGALVGGGHDDMVIPSQVIIVKLDEYQEYDFTAKIKWGAAIDIVPDSRNVTVLYTEETALTPAKAIMRDNPSSGLMTDTWMKKLAELKGSTSAGNGTFTKMFYGSKPSDPLSIVTPAEVWRYYESANLSQPVHLTGKQAGDYDLILIETDPRLAQLGNNIGYGGTAVLTNLRSWLSKETDKTKLCLGLLDLFNISNVNYYNEYNGVELIYFSYLIREGKPLIIQPEPEFIEQSLFIDFFSKYDLNSPLMNITDIRDKKTNELIKRTFALPKVEKNYLTVDLDYTKRSINIKGVYKQSGLPAEIAAYADYCTRKWEINEYYYTGLNPLGGFKLNSIICGTFTVLDDYIKLKNWAIGVLGQAIENLSREGEIKIKAKTDKTQVVEISTDSNLRIQAYQSNLAKESRVNDTCREMKSILQDYGD